MAVRIIPIRAGLGHVYLVRQNGKAFLVDTGNKSYEKKILKVVRANNTRPEDLSFIFITHAHYDHAGSAAKLKKLTAAPVIAHEKEARFLEKGYQPLPKGTAPFYKGLIAIGEKMSKTFSGFPAVTPDLTFSEGLDLSSRFDIDARIIHTPGHTLGSSVLMIDKYLFAGDTVFNVFNGVIYPIFADNEALLKESWRKILELNFEYIHPAHGKRITYKKLYTEAVKKNII